MGWSPVSEKGSGPMTLFSSVPELAETSGYLRGRVSFKGGSRGTTNFFNRASATEQRVDWVELKMGLDPADRDESGRWFAGYSAGTGGLGGAARRY